MAEHARKACARDMCGECHGRIYTAPFANGKTGIADRNPVAHSETFKGGIFRQKKLMRTPCLLGRGSWIRF